MPYETRSLRSNFVIHWTGKDIHTDYKTLCDAQREKYVDRLRSTLREESNGLWMKRNEERIEVSEGKMLGYSDVEMTCFSEIKLSATYEHTKRYGCLGLGFTRDFIMSLQGGPVHYVSGTESDVITESMARLVEYLWPLCEEKTKEIKLPELDPPFQQLELNDGYRAIFIFLRDRLKIHLIFLKKMSECTCPHDFQYLNEAEWRIIREMEGSQAKVQFFGEGEEPPAKITFEPSDLKIIVFPDDRTRLMALDDSVIMNWFGQPPDLPIIATIEECLHF